jgi:hypothetical protein
MTQDVILDVSSKNPKKLGIFSYKLDLFCTFIYEKIRGLEFLTIRKSPAIRGGGKRGIRTLGTIKLYNRLAIRRSSPLSHLSPFQIERFL